ncbi:MAG TPA: TetR/AcrR family transcriptional regulator [Acidimicrobiia bacterium]|nr:TetR/AcrR family transcriptional regulator [Acidimicrobiia bacterium]
MPRLWINTIEAHRSEVRRAVLDAVGSLIAQHGLVGVTMSGIAEMAGIGRATLYKYFPDIESILFAWHQREIESHLSHLMAVRDRAEGAKASLEAVLNAYAMIMFQSRGHADNELAALIHREDRLVQAERRLHSMIRGLLSEAGGVVRQDVSPNELASYCLQALGAAARLKNKGAVGRLVSVTLSGLYATEVERAR